MRPKWRCAFRRLMMSETHPPLRSIEKERFFSGRRNAEQREKFNNDKAVTGYFDGFLQERRARDSNSQPLSGHHISSVAASHSLTLRRSAIRSIVTGRRPGLKAACGVRAE